MEGEDVWLGNTVRPETGKKSGDIARVVGDSESASRAIVRQREAEKRMGDGQDTR
jgi:hypothetical protein